MPCSADTRPVSRQRCSRRRRRMKAIVAVEQGEKCCPEQPGARLMAVKRGVRCPSQRRDQVCMNRHDQLCQGRMLRCGQTWQGGKAKVFSIVQTLHVCAMRQSDNV